MEIGAIIGGVIGGAITVAGYFCITKWLNQKAEEREKRREVNEELRKHFQDLRSKVIERIFSQIKLLYTHNGYLVCGPFPQFSPFPEHFEFETGDSFRAFEVHLQKMGSEWKQLKSKVRKHNQNRKVFEEELEKALEQMTGIPVTEYQGTNRLPFVNKTAVIVLFEAQCALTQGVPPTDDFTRAEPKEKEDGLWGPHWALTDSLTLAVTVSRAEAEKVKAALIELQEQSNYGRRALRLFKKAGKLEDEFKTFASELNKEVAFISKHRIGKKEFNSRVDCPICSKIFE